MLLKKKDSSVCSFFSTWESLASCTHDLNPHCRNIFFSHETILNDSFQSAHTKLIVILVEKHSTVAPHPDVGGCVGFRLRKHFKTFWGYKCKEQKSNLIYLQCLGATGTVAAFCSSWDFSDLISLSICLHWLHIWLGQAMPGWDWGPQLHLCGG